MKLLEEGRQSLFDMYHCKILWDLSPSENQKTYILCNSTQFPDLAFLSLNAGILLVWQNGSFHCFLIR